MRLSLFAAMVALMFAGCTAQGATSTASVEVKNAWIRTPPPGAPTAAGYATITNHAIASDRLTGAYSSAAASVGLHEMTRLGLAYGGQQHTFSGLAGLGDLVLTCTGAASRNRRAGLALAHGEALAELERSTGQVAEGVRTSVAIARLAEQAQVEMPICAQMVAVIYGGKSARSALEELMLRELKPEAAL